MKIDYYLHSEYNIDEIVEMLKEQLEEFDLTADDYQTLARNFYSRFYEVGFNVDIDLKTMTVKKIALVE